jgi:hypothetical protein
MCLRGEARTRRDISMRAAVILLLACAMSSLASVSFWQPCDDEDNVRAQLATFHDGGFEGTDEYTAAPADNGDIQQGLPPLRVLREAADDDEADSSVAENPPWGAKPPELQPAQVHIERWDIEHMSATIETATPAFAVLRLMDYPAWRVSLNGRPVSSRPRRDDGLMVLPIPSGDARIDVSYATTRDMWAGRILTLAAVIFLIYFWFRSGAKLPWRARQQISCDRSYYGSNAN